MPSIGLSLISMPYLLPLPPMHGSQGLLLLRLRSIEEACPLTGCSPACIPSLVYLPTTLIPSWPMCSPSPLTPTPCPRLPHPPLCFHCPRGF